MEGTVRAISYKLRAASYKLQATIYKLQGLYQKSTLNGTTIIRASYEISKFTHQNYLL